MGTRGEFFENTARKRAMKALSGKEHAFPEEHAQDTNEELLDYVKACAKEIGRSPAACEVIGGNYIAKRFGSWERALWFIGLSKPKQIPKFERRLIFRQELEFQKQKFLEEKKMIRAAREERWEEAREKAEAEKLQRLQIEESFARMHTEDTDDQLLTYLQQCANDLGRTPYKKEVIGSELIRERFGSWTVALIVADLELPKDVKPPKMRELLAYHRAAAKRNKERGIENGNYKEYQN